MYVNSSLRANKPCITEGEGLEKSIATDGLNNLILFQ